MAIFFKKEKRERRHKRIRAKIFGTAEIPRFCVFRSNKHIYAQLVDDEKGHTLVAATDQELKSSKLKTQSSKSKLKTKNLKEKPKKLVRAAKISLAYEVGKLIAQKALKKKVKKIVFDRGGYKYQGRVKALAEGAREGGLEF